MELYLGGPKSEQILYGSTVEDEPLSYVLIRQRSLRRFVHPWKKATTTTHYYEWVRYTVDRSREPPTTVVVARGRASTYDEARKEGTARPTPEMLEVLERHEPAWELEARPSGKKRRKKGRRGKAKSRSTRRAVYA